MDPKGVNSIIFQMDAPLESINGSANESPEQFYNPRSQRPQMVSLNSRRQPFTQEILC